MYAMNKLRITKYSIYQKMINDLSKKLINTIV